MKTNYYSTLTLKTCAFFLIWLLLSESFNAPHLVLGVVVAFSVAWLNTERVPTRSSIRIWRLLWYFPWLVVRIPYQSTCSTRMWLRSML